MIKRMHKRVANGRLIVAMVAACLITSTSLIQNVHASYLSAPQQQQQQQSATITVEQSQAPSIIPFSFDQNVQENQRASVMCTTSSGENPVSFSWLKDGQLLAAQPAARRVTIKTDQDSSTLKIGSVRLEHAGNYTCVARNRFGQQQHSSALVVHAGPRWLREPQTDPIVAARGQTIVIDCQTTGWPRPQQTWQIKTHNKGEFEPLTTMGGRISLASNGSLVIRNVDKSDEANYRCKSSNGIGQGLSWNTSLKVTVAAYFEASARQQTSIVRRGSSVQLRCDAFGDQPITIEWYKRKHHQPMHGSAPDSNLLAASDARYSIHSNNNPLKNGLISQLHIKQAQRQDNCVYECVTRNAHGRDKLSIELVVEEEPDNIQELQVGPVDSRSVTLIWTEPYDGRSSITSYMFQYKRLQDVTLAPSSLPSSGHHNHNHNHHHQNHHSLLMNELVDFSQDSAMQSQVDQVAQHHQSQVASKAALADGDWQHAQRIVLPMANSSSQTGSVKSITIEKLEPSSKYLLRALAINAIGQSKFSQPMEFSTDEEAPEVGPVNIRATAINSTSIHVSWDEIPRNKYPGRIHGYYVGYRVASNNSAAVNFIHKPYIINDLATLMSGAVAIPTGDIPTGDTPTATSTTATTAAAAASTTIPNTVTNQQHTTRQQAAQSSYQPARLETVIQDLRRDTVYEITVLAFNRRGSGPSSDFVICKTIEMEAPKAVKLSVSRETNDSIYIEWQRDPADQNPVDYYVLYQEKNVNSAEVHLLGNQTHYRAFNLKCGTRYHFSMVAHNREGRSPPSEVVSTSTTGALPIVPSKTSLIKWVNNTCLMINLNSFQDNGCRISFLSVRYRVEKQRQLALNSGEGNSGGGANVVAGGGGVGGGAGGAGGAGGLTVAASTATNTGGLGATTGNGNAQAVDLGAANQLIGADGMSASHQALTAANNHHQATSNAANAALAAAAYSGEWIAIRPKGNNLKQQALAYEEDRVEYLCGLSPVGEYTVHVAAGNDVGRSEVEYTVLMSSDELRLSALKEMMELMSGLPNFIAYIPSILVFLIAALSLIIVCLILYATAIKYYQKFVIMQNQMRATRRAKADAKRRRKLNSNNNNNNNNGNNSSGSSRHSQKLADLWADEYEDEDMMEDEDDDDGDNCGAGSGGGAGSGDRERMVASSEGSMMDMGTADIDGDDEDAATDELSGGLGRATGRGKRAGLELVAGGKAWSSSIRRARTLQHKQHVLRPHLNLHHHQCSGSSPHSHHYLSNLASSVFDSSSMDSPCSSGTSNNNNHNHNNNNKPTFSQASTCSNESSMHGRFQCLSAKQYVKMNEYSMLPSISASLAATNPAGDIYGTAPARAAQLQQQQSVFRPLNGTSPGANSSSSNTTTSQTVSAASSNLHAQNNSMYYSTLRRATNMQTYLPQQQQQQQLQRRQSQNVADIYGYYMAPQAQAQAQAQVQAQVQAQAAAAAAAAAQQAANEAANSIFVPPQPIVYSAPNVRRQPSVFV